LRLVPRLPRRLPDRCLSGALPARCTALHFLLTIENKGPIPHEFREKIGNRIYGSTHCLAACP